MRSISVVFGAVVAGVLASSCSGPVEAARNPDEVLTRATVVVAERCAGAVVEPGTIVLTAAHCVREGDVRLVVRFDDGSAVPADVASVDRATDMAVLYLTAPSPFRGLALSDQLAPPGARLYFVGRPDRGETPQEVDVLRHGHCPSLPLAPVVLFTSMHGTPGDSGAPLVDERLRIVALVHGGARCSIAAPTWRAPAMVRAVLPDLPLTTARQ
ncbi:MAG: trypsin-like peptidase domain-containing protein [Myxococcaceae bacterium]|nr:trypsin-like peptidase domain-containing protein [Myxococcaceae bacterium]